MSSLTTLARPYAKAAFELARDNGQLSDWSEMLAVASAAAESEPLAGLLDHPDLSSEKAAALIADVGGERLDDRFRRFLDVLAESQRLATLPEIHALYEDLRADEEQRMTVRVVSAVALDDDQAARMQLALAERFDCAVQLDNEVDASLIGGAVIYAEGQVIDGSLRGRLQRMASKLTA